jgi:(1->4)-alpha-D-glucan 1-alpha-D-glucosylmutase
LNDLEPLLLPQSEERESKIEDRQALGTHPITEMLEHCEDGRIKLLLVASGLRLRRQYPQVFLQGGYLGLRAAGEKADHVVAIVRRHEDHLILAVAPRLVASLAPNPVTSPSSAGGEGSVRWLPIGESSWKSTRLDFHSSIQADSFRNVLTGEQVPVRRESDQASMNLADALSICPIALLQARTQGK